MATQGIEEQRQLGGPLSCPLKGTILNQEKPRMLMSEFLIKPLLVPTLLFAGACNHNVYTPPARSMGLTSPRVLEDGETTARANISLSSQIFGPDIAAASAGVRRGIAKRLEFVADGSYAKVVERSAAGTNRNIVMARVGVKANPSESSNLAFTAGIGGGYAPAAGMYTSADVGAVVGYENRYFVPFASVGAYVSVPFDPKEVDTTQPDDSMQEVGTPEKTTGLMIGVGFKVPLETSALLLGLTWVQVSDSDAQDEFMTLGAGVETKF